jgi:hypothetical protein
MNRCQIGELAYWDTESIGQWQWDLKIIHYVTWNAQLSILYVDGMHLYI